LVFCADLEVFDADFDSDFDSVWGSGAVLTWGAGRDLDFGSLGLREGMSVGAA
jgi:hypothetical protein